MNRLTNNFSRKQKTPVLPGEKLKNMETKTQEEKSGKSHFGDTLKHLSGYDGLEAETIGTVGALVGELLVQNWSQIKSCRDRSDDASVTISFGVEVNASGKVPIVKAKISYSQKFADSAEAMVDDPDQAKLDLNTEARKLHNAIKKAGGGSISIDGKVVAEIGGAK